MNIKPVEKKRIKKLVMITPDADEYLKLKSELFRRGKLGGYSEALNRMVVLVRDWEAAQKGGSGV